MKSLQYYAFCLSFFLPFSYKQSESTCLCTALNQMLRSMWSLLSKGVTYLHPSTFFAYSIIWLPLPVHRWWRRKKMAALWIISHYSCDLKWMWSVCLRGDDVSWIAHMCLSEACVFKGQRWKVTNYIYSRYCNWVAFLCTCTFLSNVFNL